ncbi:MAG TPA: PAS domain S-box protein [Thermoanaerobaculia bacterium]
MAESKNDRDHGLPAPTSDELALLIDEVQDYAIFLMGNDGEIRTWNRGAARIFGYEAADAIGRNFRMFYPEEDLANRKPEHELEVAEREGRIEDEGWRIRADGVRFWVNTVITALRNPDGKLRGFAKVTRDLTKRRAADEQLRQSEEMFRLLVANVQDYAIFMLDTGGHIASWNAGAHRIKGYTAEEIIGKHFSIFYPEEDIRSGKPPRELEIAQEYGVYEEEGWRLRKDGSRFWANVVITAVHDETGTLRGFAKVTRDITERKQAEETQRALLQQREARLTAEEERRRAEASFRVAQEANRAKDEFLMTLSHELRTPMTAILGWARLLPTMTPGDTMFREAVASIARGAQLQARLIDDVLDVSRIVSGKMRLTRERMNIESVINASIDAVRPTAAAREIQIETKFSPPLGWMVADPTRLQQVVWNLLTNAVKFTPKRGVIIVGARRTSSHLEICVEDNGEGIDSRFLPHVFEPFRQAENPQTRVHGGLGLGLSIVRYIVEAHGGTIAAESRGRGKGATFTVTLPIAAVATAQVESHAPNVEKPMRAIAPDRLRGISLLLVDDDAEARGLIRAILMAAGAEVTAAESAPAALTALTTACPDAIITDIAMPQMDGYTFSREVRARPELDSVKLIVLSAFPAAAQAGDGMFNGYLTKPVDPADLVDDVARIVRNGVKA